MTRYTDRDGTAKMQNPAHSIRDGWGIGIEVGIGICRGNCSNHMDPPDADAIVVEAL